jgi:hypothetical protein
LSRNERGRFGALKSAYGQWERASKITKYFSVIAEKYFK